MKAILLATVSVAALTSARAADLPVKAPAMPVVANWNGWYAGVQGGFAAQYGTFLDRDGLLIGANGFGPQTYRLSDVGGIFGGHVGYNWQSSNRTVVGIEADGNGVWARANGLEGPFPPSSVTFDTKWLATLRGRIGMTVVEDVTLLYLSGGLAIGRVKNNATLIQNGVTNGIMNQESTKVGWTVGGGIERMLGQRWTVRAELRYVDLGNSAVTCPATACAVGPYRGEFSNRLLLGLVGASLKF